MPDPKQGEDTPVVDAFGNSDNPEPEKKEEPQKKYEDIPQDHPTVVKLNQEIERVKSEYGSNLSGQRKVIEQLEKDLEEFKKSGGKEEKKDEEDVLYKEIKWSKDLTDEEREDMTETEIKQMDEIAEMKTKQNDIYKSQNSNKKQEESKKADDMQSLVKETALAIAQEETGTEDVDLANQIIESVKQFNLEGLDVKTIKERVATARKLLPDYTAPKETVTKKGNTVKATSSETDPFGTDAIVESVSSQRNTDYSL